LPNSPSLALRMLRELPFHGILLTGGDVPVSYGGGEPRRDATETVILNEAVALQLPVIGVCRGMQFIGVHMGGRLAEVEGHVAVRHEIRSGHDRRTVNSFHRWALVDVGPSLDATWKMGTTIEAVRHRTLPIAGMMWHPEREDTASRDDTDFFANHYSNNPSETGRDRTRFSLPAMNGDRR
jgi:N5-(cytidine 5'-diphosphoramidyl)-L-glutamine hydrolase